MKILSLLAAGLILAGTIGVASSGAITQRPDAGMRPAAESPADSTLSGGDAWDWPLSPKPGVERPFDPPPKPWMSGHRGVDLRAAAAGSPVLAPYSGTVAFVGIVVDRPVITIDHGNGLKSSFEPVTSTLATGTPVEKGQLIGTLESGHCSPTACLHWGVRQGDEYLNPLAFVLDLRPSVLLPLFATGAVAGGTLDDCRDPGDGTARD